jgi:K(+)-stimulated pyrophosphate-energized sodium pump
MELVFMIPVAIVAAALYAAYLARDVLSRDEGTPEMQEVAGMIFEGAMAFLKRQYTTIAIFAALTAVALVVIVGAVSEGVRTSCSSLPPARSSTALMQSLTSGRRAFLPA